MASHVNALRVRGRLGRSQWRPPEPFGPDGFTFVATDDTASVIVTCAQQDDGEEWVHASIARDTMPTYADLVMLHRAAFGDAYAFQVFAPSAAHVNIHERALHLWGRLDGSNPLPDFGALGSI